MFNFAKINTKNISESGKINFFETSIMDLSAMELATKSVMP